LRQHRCIDAPALRDASSLLKKLCVLLGIDTRYLSFE
jgi:hypothetical protein